MELTPHFGGSCAVTAIVSLSRHTDAVDAMKTFCGRELGRLDGFIAKYAKLAAYYVFTAGPEVKPGEQGSSHWSVAGWTKYGTEFAQFIRDNNLGEIVTVGPKYNMKHHPTTTAQVWLWNPDQNAMEAWWSTMQGKTPEVPAPVKQAVAVAPDEDEDEDDPDFGEEPDYEEDWDDDRDGDEDRY
jgi:hypothetical protein